MAGEHAAARVAYRRAARRTRSLPEQRYLEGRAARLADMSAADLAQRSGATVEEVRRLMGVGIVAAGETDRPFSISDVQRVRLVRALDRSGIPLEAVGAAVRSGHLSFAFVDALFPEPPPLGAKTVRDVAAELGLSLETVTHLYAMWGLPRPGPDDAIREDDAAVFAEWAAMLPPRSLTQDVLVHGARLLGEAARRVGDFAFDVSRTYVEAPMLASGGTLQQVMDTTGAFSHQATASLQRQLAWLVNRQLEHNTTQFAIEYVEAAIESAGVAPPRPAVPPAMAFLDLRATPRSPRGSATTRRPARDAARRHRAGRRERRRRSGDQAPGDGAMVSSRIRAPPCCPARGRGAHRRGRAAAGARRHRGGTGRVPRGRLFRADRERGRPVMDRARPGRSSRRPRSSCPRARRRFASTTPGPSP
jgi:hypothetical protein